MIVAVVQLQRSFVMATANDWDRLQAGKPAHKAFWSFTLAPFGNGQSRLIARAWRNAGHACVARGGQIVLGAHALHHGAEDAAYHQRPIGARLAELEENILRTGSGNLGSDVWIPVGSGDLPPLVSVPEQPAPWPGVVVLHDSRWHVGRPA